jgi:hypothetical protein
MEFHLQAAWIGARGRFIEPDSADRFAIYFCCIPSIVGVRAL